MGLTQNLGRLSGVITHLNGNIGIGTSSPSGALHISGSTYSSSRIYLQRTSGALGTFSMGVQSADNNFGIVDEAQGNLTRLLITSTGNVIIGGGSDNSLGKLQVSDTGVFGGGVPLAFTNIGTGTYNKTNIYNQTSGFNIDLARTTDSSGGTPIPFIISARGGTEFFRITSGGTVVAGSTNSSPSGTENAAYLWIPSQNRMYVSSSSTAASFGKYSTTGVIVGFDYAGSGVGSISTNGSSVAYNTTSDYRLKQDFEDFNGLNLIDSIKVYDYQWKLDSSRSFGVKAHELQSIIPYAVNGEKDAVDENNKPIYQGVDYSKLVPVLVKAIQELKQELDELKNK